MELTHKIVARIFMLFALVFLPVLVQAGVLFKADIEKIFTPDLVVGEKNVDIPIWPLFSKSDAKLVLRGYAFESIDFEAVRGYGAKPINILVAISPEGLFMDVRLIGHKEPLFMHPQGNAVLNEFAQQYKGLTLNHRIDILSPKAKTSRDETYAVLHGVTAGTVTVKAMDRSIIESAFTVAKAHLSTSSADPVSANADSKKKKSSTSQRLIEHHTTMTWDQLLDKSLVQTQRLTRSQIEQSFLGTRAEGNDKLAVAAPQEMALELHTALVSIPQIGRNILDEEGWRQLSSNMRSASNAILVIESGPLAKMAYESQRVQQPIPFVLKQNGRVLTLRSMAYANALALPGYSTEQNRAHILLVDSTTPLDVTQPFDLRLQLSRRFGSFPGQIANVEFPVTYHLTDTQSLIADSYEPGWVGSWRQRTWEIAVLCLGLLVLTVVLSRQKWISVSQQRLQRFRVVYLLFVVGFIGWYAQGQLTIVNITSSLEALVDGGDLSFLLSDPMTIILWGFVIATLFVWGRGTFCGWLCPFGALQELISLLTQRFGFKPKRLRAALDGQLKRVKYGVLAFIVVSVFAAPSTAEIAVEIEPFKTAISLYFVRDWPYVMWALACLSLSVMVYRGYCRYICPLGAALAATSFLQRWEWIPRRAQCGTPCQSCRHRCVYQAIKPTGKVDYAECFQCLDCVSIYQDNQRCLPLIHERKEGARVITIKPFEVI